MRPPTEKQALKLLPRRLAESLGLEPKDAKMHLQPASVPRADAVIEIGGFTFVIEWKGSGTIAQISDAVRQAQHYAATLGGRAVPLVAVPFMGPAGRELCEEAKIGWLDLSGNAHFVAPGLRVKIEGQPNRYKGPGRPASVFAPKSSRIARWLLMHPKQPLTQRELATATKMDEGFTSRIVAKLEEDELIIRDPSGRIRARDPNLLLDAWAEAYSFSKHRILRGHIPARSSEAQMRSMADVLVKKHEQYAATGLAAAWLLNRFAGFRVVTIYLGEPPEPALLEQLGFREGEAGANTWLVVPNDEGVFDGASDQDGMRCVHPIQAYLDLQEHPERAKEAAEQLRKDLLRQSADA
jgi:MarR family protein/transcriptional regulator with AbiEi antitoxin domain of type IV toxin-antitoxin system